LTTALAGGQTVVVTPRTTQPYSIVYGSLPGQQKYSLHITYRLNDVTGSNVTSLVGQRMYLYCQLEDSGGTVITTPAMTNFSWTIPGFAISNYVADDSSGVVITNFPTTTNDVAFYWVDGGSKQVQCSATAAGQTFTAQTTFNVLKPLAKVTATIISPITLDYVDGPPTLHFGSAEPGTQPGILFSNSIAIPAEYTGNTNYTFEWIQKVNYLKERLQTNDASGAWYSLQASNVLDSQYPYPSPDARFSDFCTSDSPESDTLDTYTNISFTNNFTMWLMFQPSGGVMVPVRTVNWSWNATGAFNGVTGNVISSNSVANPDSDAIGNYPIWTDNVTNHFNLQRE
jgi:hypothetical protein